MYFCDSCMYVVYMPVLACVDVSGMHSWFQYTSKQECKHRLTILARYSSRQKLDSLLSHLLIFP